MIMVAAKSASNRVPWNWEPVAWCRLFRNRGPFAVSRRRAALRAQIAQVVIDSMNRVSRRRFRTENRVEVNKGLGKVFAHRPTLGAVSIEVLIAWIQRTLLGAVPCFPFGREPMAVDALSKEAATTQGPTFREIVRVSDQDGAAITTALPSGITLGRLLTTKDREPSESVASKIKSRCQNVISFGGVGRAGVYGVAPSYFSLNFTSAVNRG